jgi:hypothetical protein
LTALAQLYSLHKEVIDMSPEHNDAGISHKEFFEKSLTAAGEWTRFADPKALGVAVSLSFGANDLIRNAQDLFFGFPVLNFPKSGSGLEWWMSVAFLGACVFGVLTVGFVSAALFPRRKPKGPESLFYFGGIARIKDAQEYERQVREKTPQQLESQIAIQAWNLARTANKKHRMTQWAYVWLVLFFVCWVAAHVMLSFVP